LSYTRNFESGQNTRDPTFPRFHMHSVQDPIASEAAGRPIFVQQERIQFIMPGSPNQPVEVVTDVHRQRWPEQYAAFRRGEDATTDGTPLEHWSLLSRSHVLEMKALGIHSVEQCAGLSDAAVQKIGMGGHRIRELAKAYLDEADQQRITSEALARAEKAEARFAALEKNNTELKDLVDRLHSELMALKSAPNPIASVIPGSLDPIQVAAQGMPLPPAAPSSLDSLARPRGRPRKDAA
jgi:hypothetical protein